MPPNPPPPWPTRTYIRSGSRTTLRIAVSSLADPSHRYTHYLPTSEYNIMGVYTSPPFRYPPRSTDDREGPHRLIPHHRCRNDAHRAPQMENNPSSDEGTPVQQLPPFLVGTVPQQSRPWSAAVPGRPSGRELDRPAARLSVLEGEGQAGYVCTKGTGVVAVH